MMSFNMLPYELYLCILSNLSIKELQITKKVSTLFAHGVREIIYKKILKKYFPHHYISPRTSNAINDTNNYKYELMQAIKNDYRCMNQDNFLNKKEILAFTHEEINIFNAAKDGNTELFLQFFTKIVNDEKALLRLLHLTDQTQRNFFQWAGYFGNQNILDIVFSALSKFFIEENEIKYKEEKFGLQYIKLVILCNQIKIVKNIDDQYLAIPDTEHPLEIFRLATECCHIKMIECFLKKIPELNNHLKSINDFMQFSAATFGNNETLIFWIPNAPQDIKKQVRLLNQSIQGNNVASLKYLIGLSCAVDRFIPENAVTLIQMALHKHRFKLTLILLKEKNCAVDALLNRTLYQNPYVYSSKLNQILANSIFQAVISTYLDKNGHLDIHRVDEYGNSIFHWIAYCNQVAQLKSLLAQLKSVPNDFNKSKQSPAELAAIFGHQNILEIYLKNGLSVNHQGYYGYSLLNLACCHNHEDLVNFLLAFDNIDVNLGNSHCSTPLRGASEEGYYNIVVALLEAGADINHSNLLNMTPLISAAQKGHAAIVNFLLKQPGIDIEKKTPNGFTALDYAKIKKHRSCVDLLQNKSRKNCFVQ